jgi:mannose-6-phosphate isomerase-like protein (cupin superfamily)
MTQRSGQPYTLVHFDDVEPVECPCGLARRALADVKSFPATVHRTTITDRAKPHYHRTLCETYYILECEPNARMRLGDEVVSVCAGTLVHIPPGTVHQAIGRMTVLIFVVPKFNPSDEVLVEDAVD